MVEIVQSENAQSASQRKSHSFYEVVSEIAKFAFFLAFVLYAIGFLIWHSFLAQYGVSLTSLFPTDYLAAATCYLVILAILGIPPALIINRIGENIASRLDNNVRSAHALQLLGVWFIGCVYLQRLYFPPPTSSPTHSETLLIILAIFALHLASLLLTFRQWGETKWYKFLASPHFYYLYYTAFILASCFWRPNVSFAFVFNTLIIYFVAYNAIRSPKHTKWAELTIPFKILCCIIISLVVVSNVQQFGTSQFGFIPRKVGGGQLQPVYLKFNAQHLELASQLGILTTDTVALSNGFVGPVQIILRTDQQIVFLNVVSNTPTVNLASSLKATNSPAPDSNHIFAPLHTNIVRNSTSNTLTNVIPAAPQPIAFDNTPVSQTNQPRTNAKEIRADFIEAIKFLRQ